MNPLNLLNRYAIPIGLAALLALSSSANASVIYAGSDTSTGVSWRNAGVAKTLDADGDNIYGSAGYAVSAGGDGFSAWTPSTAPAYASVSFFGFHWADGFMNDIDDPVAGAPNQTNFGERWTNGVGANNNFTFFQITLTQDANFRLGVVSDAHSIAFEWASNIIVEQTVGGSSSAQTGSIDADINNSFDYYFFDINGSAGDVYTISASQATNESYMSIGDLLTFDELASGTSVPLPGGLALLGLGLVLLRRSRRS